MAFEVRRVAAQELVDRLDEAVGLVRAPECAPNDPTEHAYLFVDRMLPRTFPLEFEALHAHIRAHFPSAVESEDGGEHTGFLGIDDDERLVLSVRAYWAGVLSPILAGDTSNDTRSGIAARYVDTIDERVHVVTIPVVLVQCAASDLRAVEFLDQARRRRWARPLSGHVGGEAWLEFDHPAWFQPPGVDVELVRTLLEEMWAIDGEGDAPLELDILEAADLYVTMPGEISEEFADELAALIADLAARHPRAVLRSAELPWQLTVPAEEGDDTTGFIRSRVRGLLEAALEP